jgi:hypothetical protein
MDRQGACGPLTIYIIGLIVVFLGYASVQKVYVL